MFDFSALPASSSEWLHFTWCPKKDMIDSFKDFTAQLVEAEQQEVIQFTNGHREVQKVKTIRTSCGYPFEPDQFVKDGESWWIIVRAMHDKKALEPQAQQVVKNPRRFSTLKLMKADNLDLELNTNYTIDISI